MTTQTVGSLYRIRVLLAERLEGMRQSCPCLPSIATHCRTCAVYWYPNDRGESDGGHHGPWCQVCEGKGWLPVPLTAEGKIDLGRLLRAIEAAGLEVSYKGDRRVWAVRGEDALWRIRHDSDLAIAFLRAVGEEGV